MSKITFRADEDLVRRLDEFESSKSEVMREALRTYLDDAKREGDEFVDSAVDSAVDNAIAERVDELVAERIDALLDVRDAHDPGARHRRPEPRDVNVNIALDGHRADADVNAEARGERRVDDERKTRREQGADESGERACDQCGEAVASDHVYCPNCGEKAADRVFCDCGDEIRTDWAFCPRCGRRTPAADVLDRT